MESASRIESGVILNAVCMRRNARDKTDATKAKSGTDVHERFFKLKRENMMALPYKSYSFQESPFRVRFVFILTGQGFQYKRGKLVQDILDFQHHTYN